MKKLYYFVASILIIILIISIAWIMWDAYGPIPSTEPGVSSVPVTSEVVSSSSEEISSISITEEVSENTEVSSAISEVSIEETL